MVADGMHLLKAGCIVTEWMELSGAVPELGLDRRDIELLALSQLNEAEYDHRRGLITPIGLGHLVEVLQEVLDGD